MFKYWWLIGSILCFLFYRASFERFVKKHGWFLFPELLLSIRDFFFQNICFSYVDKKEMGNWKAVKVCVNVEIKFWFIQKRLLLDHTGSEMKSFVFNFRQLLVVIQKPGLLFQKIETCRSSNSSRIHYFSLKFCACVLLAMLTKVFSVLFCSSNEKSENRFSWST